MRIISSLVLPSLVLGALGSVALVGVAAAHTMTVRLPDGSLEQIEYSGNVAPQVSFTPTTPEAALFAGPVASPFAQMDQISALMDREAANMFNQMQVQMRTMQAAFPLNGPLDAGFGHPLQVDLSRMPPGAQGYSFVATLTPSGVCTQSVEITSTGPGQKPQLVSQHSGNCGPASGAAAPTTVATPQAAPARPTARTIQANAVTRAPYSGMVRNTSF